MLHSLDDRPPSLAARRVFEGETSCRRYSGQFLGLCAAPRDGRSARKGKVSHRANSPGRWARQSWLGSSERRSVAPGHSSGSPKRKCIRHKPLGRPPRLTPLRPSRDASTFQNTWLSKIRILARITRPRRKQRIVYACAGPPEEPEGTGTREADGLLNQSVNSVPAN